MNRIERIYAWLLRLYPHKFRASFGEEMQAVFREGLESARAQGETGGFLLREALHLPLNLLRVYLWSMRSAQAAFAGAGSRGGSPATVERWTGLLMAGLPHLLLGLEMILTSLLTGIRGGSVNWLGNLLGVAFFLLVLGVFLYGLLGGWKRWSASWLAYMLLVIFAALSIGGQALEKSLNSRGNWLYFFQTLLFPSLLAYLLYKTASADRLRGLLAVVGPAAMFWGFNFQEFVPALPKALAYGWVCLLAFAGAVLVLRARRFAWALISALLIPALAGPPFVYLSLTVGGMRSAEPFTLGRLMESYLPFLVLMLAMILGPQLAAALRDQGIRYQGTGGKVFYRFALGGVLLALLVVLAISASLGSSGARGFMLLGMVTAREVAAVLAAAIYAAGFSMLAWAMLQSSGFRGRDALKLAALFLLLPGVPLALIMYMPGHSSGALTIRVWAVAGIAWALATAWIVGAVGEETNG